MHYNTPKIRNQLLFAKILKNFRLREDLQANPATQHPEELRTL